MKRDPFDRSGVEGGDRAAGGAAEAVGRGAEADPGPGLYGGVLGGIRILVVDDDSEVRAAVQAALAAAGAEVVGAGSVDEALDALDWFNPLVLVSDVGMPGRDGCSLVREVRTRPPERGGNLQAVALTAFSGSEVRRRILEAGFQLHAMKPIETSALIAIVACLARRAA